MKKRTVLIWFRNDLRVQDNEMLSRASERDELIIPVFCFDPRYFTQTKFKTLKTGLIRARFIKESVDSLQQFFKSHSGNMIIQYGRPEEVIPFLALKYQVDEVYHHREVADEETRISSLVEDALWRNKINLRHFIGHTLFHKEDFPFPVKDIPDSFSVFQKRLEKESFVRECFESPTAYRFAEGIEESLSPSLEELGFDSAEIAGMAPSEFKGGEFEANSRLHLLLEGGGGEDSAVIISPWVALGCLSVHTLYFAVQGSSLSKSMKESILQGLWWKDYYRFMFKKHGNVFFQDKGYTGNAQALAEDQGSLFESWKNGSTPDENINLIMRQLNESGYIDFESRVLVATYLIDQLKVNWLLGASYFEEKLIDYGPSSNYGNWAHLAGVGSSFTHNRMTFAN